jgi:hypothetical protein
MVTHILDAHVGHGYTRDTYWDPSPLKTANELQEKLFSTSLIK